MKLNLVILFVLLSLLSNCSRYYYWAQDTFANDGVKRVCPLPCQYICSKNLYDNFRTVALIDVLWLNPVVRKAYVDLCCQRRCLSAIDRDKMLKQEFEKLEKEISFYILIPPSKQDNFSSDFQSTAPWSISLQVDDCSYQPYHIKAVDLEPEYAYFFNCFSLDDRNFFRYRQTYLVKFRAKDKNRKFIKIINPSTCNIQLTISTVNYTTSCAWQISPDKREIY